jgi:hypothetical protein
LTLKRSAQAELLVRLERALERPQVIEIAGRQVRVGMVREDRLRERSSGLRPVARVEPLEPDTAGGSQLAKVDESLISLLAGILPPPVLAVVVAPDVPVHAVVRHARDVRLAARRAEASAGKLDRTRRRSAAARGDEVDGAAQRIAPEQRSVARQNLDALDVVHRQQVEIDLRRLRLIHPDTIEKHGQALRQAHDR